MTGVRLRNVRTGNTLEKTFRAGERMERAILERRELQFLYRAGDEYVFMDNESFDQISIPGDELGDSVDYLKEGLTVAAQVCGLDEALEQEARALVGALSARR